MTNGETNLSKLLGGMTPVLHEGVYGFATLASVPERLNPLMIFREHEGITIIAQAGDFEATAVEYGFRCRMITLNVHSSLEAVGFLAAITARLAEAGMGVNPVSAFYHDHLFVPEERAEEAFALLQSLAREHAI
ncbi:MAG: ACT domain-containing protein [Mesorhizobium sp.]